jgi:hypothetical protein
MDRIVSASYIITDPSPDTNKQLRTADKGYFNMLRYVTLCLRFGRLL